MQFEKDRTVIFSVDSTFKVSPFQIYWAFTSDSIKIYTLKRVQGKTLQSGNIKISSDSYPVV
jgi:hypothetical protein